METALGIKQRIIEKMADIDAAKSRWVAIMVFFLIIFGIALGIFFSPASELGTQKMIYQNLKVNANTIDRYEVVAVPGMFTMTFEVEMDASPGLENNWVFAYLYRDQPPDMSKAEVEEDMRPFLLSNAYLAQRLTYESNRVEWVVPWVDSGSTVYYVVLYNPKNQENLYQGDMTPVKVTSYYEPTLPLIPITFLFLLIIIPLGIVRIYVLNQKKKELRIQLSLDLDNLSNEDRIRLGIPMEPMPPPGARQGMPPPS
ncbi:MAG: hypothetical protein QCI82_00200 [Candidatus Thermoplasmatota archaeon]|nr:hypothetical protein [Candidatus Thermoplasmatota archaeon]